MEEKKIQLGDVVKLKSGGDWMTVINEDTGWIVCIWYEDGEIKQTPSIPSVAVIKSE